MEAYSRVYDSRHLQVDCQELGSAPEPYARLSCCPGLGRLLASAAMLRLDFGPRT